MVLADIGAIVEADVDASSSPWALHLGWLLSFGLVRAELFSLVLLSLSTTSTSTYSDVHACSASVIESS